jgi:hypothetical protein
LRETTKPFNPYSTSFSRSTSKIDDKSSRFITKNVQLTRR